LNEVRLRAAWLGPDTEAAKVRIEVYGIATGHECIHTAFGDSELAKFRHSFSREDRGKKNVGITGKDWTFPEIQSIGKNVFLQRLIAL